MENLKVTLVQSDIYWENIDANLTMFSEKLESIESTDIIILPEMFTTGFSMNSATFSDSMNGKVVAWMRNASEKKNAVIMGSFMVEDDGKYYNRLVWMRPDGTFEKYDKKHLFRMAGENNHFSAGDKKLIVELKGWKICPMICYDLRFPVWSRRVENNTANYDLLIYIASWPDKRNHAWKSLLPARAIENMSYVIGINRVGKDGNGLTYSGDSILLNTMGEGLINCTPYQEEIKTIELSASEFKSYRELLSYNLDADKFELK